MTPGVSAGSNHVGASVTWSAMVTCPSGEAAAGADEHASATTARARSERRAFTGPPRSASLELEILVRRHERMAGDGGHVGQPRPDPGQGGLLDDRPEHRALVHELLDLVQQRLATLPVHLAGLVAEQRVDVGIAAVGADAAPDHEGLDAGGGVAG